MLNDYDFWQLFVFVFVFVKQIVLIMFKRNALDCSNHVHVLPRIVGSRTTAEVARLEPDMRIARWNKELPWLT